MHHESAAGISCLPSARPGHLLRSGGSGLGRDGAAYPSYRLTCCETPVCRVTDWFGCCLVTVSRVVWWSWWLAINQHRILFSCFLVEGLRLSSPYRESRDTQPSKETNWSQPITESVVLLNYFNLLL